MEGEQNPNSKDMSPQDDEIKFTAGYMGDSGDEIQEQLGATDDVQILEGEAVPEDILVSVDDEQGPDVGESSDDSLMALYLQGCTWQGEEDFVHMSPPSPEEEEEEEAETVAAVGSAKSEYAPKKKQLKRKWVSEGDLPTALSRNS